MKNEKTTLNPETIEKKNESFEEIFNRIDLIIDYLESGECDKKYIEKEINDLSELYSMIAKDHIFLAKMAIGISEFKKRFKRRARRKPLTVRKMRSLNDDLLRLARILQI